LQDSAKTSVVECVDAKDFTFSAYKVVISRVQQEALDRANAKVPCPADQLALLNAKKGKTKDRGKLGLI